MTIPEIRVGLLRMAHRLGGSDAAILRLYERELHRRPPVRKVPVRRITPKGLKKDIHGYLAICPDADYMEIAAVLGVNTGRVSTALAGFRT